MNRAAAIRIANEHLQQLASDGLRQLDARLYSHHSRLRHGQPGLPTWQGAEAMARLHDAAQLLHAGLLLRSFDGAGWRACIRRAGEVLEWLSHTAMQLEGVPTRLLSAAAYDLAGFPARADALLRPDAGESESGILRAFLRGDFPGALERIRRFWEQQTVRTAGTTDPPENVSAWLIQETVRALGVVCASLRWGDEDRTKAAIEKLDAIASLLTIERDPYSWLLARLTAECVRETVSHAWRPTLAPLAEHMPTAGQEAMDRYARLNFIFRRAVVWPSQRDGIQRLQSPGSFALCTPTGSGKTSVAEVAILQAILSGSEDLTAPLCLYLVPSRALAAEVEGKLHRVLQRLTDRRVVVTGLYGGTDWGPTDAWLTSDDPTVLICTYEKGEALIRFLGPLFLGRLTLVVFDEAHMVQFNGNTRELREAENRCFRLESLAMRIRRLIEPMSCRMIALSAVAVGLEDALHRWVGGDEGASPVQTGYRSTRQLIGRLEFDMNGRCAIRYDFLDGRALAFSTDQEATPYVPSPVPPCPRDPAWTGVEKPLRPALLWAALHLAGADDEGTHHAVLVSVTQKIAGVAKDFLELLEGTWSDRTLPKALRAPASEQEQALWDQTLAVCIDYFGTRSYEYRLLRFGIVVHHSNLPKLLGRLLVDLVQAGIANVVLATSTLSEGVNIPVETILVPSLLRWPKPMSAPEFRNLAGRAGRPGIATEGRTLVLLRSGVNDTSAQRYGALARELLLTAQPEQPRSPIVAAIHDIWDEWRRLNGSIDVAAFLLWLETIPLPSPTTSPFGSLDTLDGLLLSGFVEHEEIRALSNWEASLQELWNGAFNAHQATEFERLAFVRRGRGIPALYPNRDIRRRVYRTGLPPSTAMELLAIVDEIRGVLKSGHPYAGWNPEQRGRFIADAIEAVSRIPRFRGDPDPTVWRERLRWWMQVPAAPQPNENKIANWHSDVSKWFTYRFCWGLGSVIGVSFDALHNGQLQATSLDQWDDTGLPWIVFWLKELLSWGTLDPPAAFLLSRGLARSRPEAAAVASAYYGSTFAVSIADPLDPRAIRDWADSTFGTVARVRQTVESRRIVVEITDVAIASLAHQLAVLPSRDRAGITWLDAAGFVVARTPEMPWAWTDIDISTTDFRLSPLERVVTAKPYL